MSILYLVAFIAGMALGVRIMMYGVERPRDEHPAGERSFRMSPALLMTFLMTFGAVGYILVMRQIGTTVTQLAVATVAGAVVAAVTARLVRQWWTVTPEHDVDDERYVLQGHLARVTKSIRADVDGEVTFELENQQRVFRARSYDATAIDAGTEVVIERIEGDVVYVEAWQEVEKRL